MNAETREAIEPHETDVVDESWDGPEAEARIPNDASFAELQQAYAWVSEDVDEDDPAKNDFSFIHHEVSQDGQVGSANVRACVTGIAILNGGRGVDPDEQEWSGDRQGIWDHLASHLEDDGREPPELDEDVGERSVMDDRETRFYQLDVRDNGDDSDTLEGTAAVFDSPTNMGTHEEVIREGAFEETLENGADVRMLWNHNPEFVFGRTKSGTLDLETSDRGLEVRNEPPDAQWADDAIESIRRGDVDQMSFGFRVKQDQWTEREDEPSLREIMEVELFDVSPVTFPAYSDTEVSVRDRIKDMTDQERYELIEELRRSVEPDTDPDEAREKILEMQEAEFHLAKLRMEC